MGSPFFSQNTDRKYDLCCVVPWTCNIYKVCKAYWKKIQKKVNYIFSFFFII